MEFTVLVRNEQIRSVCDKVTSQILTDVLVHLSHPSLQLFHKNPPWNRFRSFVLGNNVDGDVSILCFNYEMLEANTNRKTACPGRFTCIFCFILKIEVQCYVLLNTSLSVADLVLDYITQTAPPQEHSQAILFVCPTKLIKRQKDASDVASHRSTLLSMSLVQCFFQPHMHGNAFLIVLFFIYSLTLQRQRFFNGDPTSPIHASHER